MKIILILMLVISNLHANENYEQEFTLTEQLNMCKSGFYSERFKLYKLTNYLNSHNQIAESYFATKGVSQLGMGYLLLVNYSNYSILITISNIGINERKLSRLDGEKILQDILVEGYKEVKNDLDEDLFHPSCTFYSFSDSDDTYQFELLNSQGIKDSIGNIINIKASKLLNDEIKKYHKESCKNYSFEMFENQLHNSDYSEKDFDLFKSNIINNLFYELQLLKN